MFTNNKYFIYYNNIIEAAKSRVLTNTYVEKHHIIPKSLGGSNLPDNIVQLTAKEHFICHRLLTKFTTGNDKHKMIYAVWRMVNPSKKHKRHIPNSRVYQLIKLEMSVATSERVKNTKLSDEHKKKIGLSKIGKTRNITPEWREKIVKSMTGLTRDPYSEEHKKKISDAQRGVPRGSQSDEHKQNISAAKKGKKLHIDPNTGRRYMA